MEDYFPLDLYEQAALEYIKITGVDPMDYACACLIHPDFELEVVAAYVENLFGKYPPMPADLYQG